MISMATIKKAVTKVVKKAAVKKVVKKEVKTPIFTECMSCDGRGLETTSTLCRHCHGSGRI